MQQFSETTKILACIIYFNTEISVMGRTETSVVRPQYRNFCAPYVVQKISVLKLMKQAMIVHSERIGKFLWSTVPDNLN